MALLSWVWWQSGFRAGQGRKPDADETCQTREGTPVWPV
jgi:hypothetical protein